MVGGNGILGEVKDGVLTYELGWPGVYVDLWAVQWAVFESHVVSVAVVVIKIDAEKVQRIIVSESVESFDAML